MPSGASPGHPYTPLMRRWVCVAALLYGFAGDRYAWSVRTRLPIPIERPLPIAVTATGLVPTLAWWRR